MTVFLNSNLIVVLQLLCNLKANVYVYHNDVYSKLLSVFAQSWWEVWERLMRYVNRLTTSDTDFKAVKLQYAYLHSPYLIDFRTQPNNICVYRNSSLQQFTIVGLDIHTLPTRREQIRHWATRFNVSAEGGVKCNFETKEKYISSPVGEDIRNTAVWRPYKQLTHTDRSSFRGISHVF